MLLWENDKLWGGNSNSNYFPIITIKNKQYLKKKNIVIGIEQESLVIVNMHIFLSMWKQIKKPKNYLRYEKFDK